MMIEPLFRNRRDAGRQLAGMLSAYADRPDVLVLALPRGGVPVAFEVAQRLNAALDIFVVRKLGMPGHEEFAIGAIASGGVGVLNKPFVARAHIPRDTIKQLVAREERELLRREQAYRGDRPPPALGDRTIILIDDGLATGSTMHAATLAIRKHRPARLVVAVPVAAPETCDGFRSEVDEIVCARTPEPFFAVGSWYEDFAQTSDDEVRQLLAQARREPLVQERARETAFAHGKRA